MQEATISSLLFANFKNSVKKVRFQFSTGTSIVETVAGNDDYHEFAFTARKAKWVKLTVLEPTGGIVGAREIGFGCGRVAIKGCDQEGFKGAGFECGNAYDLMFSTQWVTAEVSSNGAGLNTRMRTCAQRTRAPSHALSCAPSDILRVLGPARLHDGYDSCTRMCRPAMLRPGYFSTLPKQCRSSA